MPTVGINPFVRRQTADSRFSHFDGDLDAVADMAALWWSSAREPGYRDGVVLVSVLPKGFFSGVVEVTEETPLLTTFEARQRGEDPVLVTVALKGEKLPAGRVDLVLYRRDVLLEDFERERKAAEEKGETFSKTEAGYAPTGREWELVSINAEPGEADEPAPLTPDAMARNYLSLPGGTKADYSAEEFARSILYWSCRAMIGGE